jgi:hypothetical protein
MLLAKIALFFKWAEAGPALSPGLTDNFLQNEKYDAQWADFQLINTSG